MRASKAVCKGTLSGRVPGAASRGVVRVAEQLRSRESFRATSEPWQQPLVGAGVVYQELPGELSLKLNQEDVEDAGFVKVKAIVTEAKSYDVLVGTTVLYPMGFTLDFWEEKASYKPGWQTGDERKA
jgi:hypothetical protein